MLAMGSLRQPGAAAQYDGPTPTRTPGGPSTWQDLQQAMLADRQPSQALDPMAATPCVGGYAGAYPCSNVDLLAFLPHAAIGGGQGNVVWGWTDPLTGKEYALVGRTTGTAFVDIGNPTNPIYLGNLPTASGTSIWRDIRVYANHAFVVSDYNGAHGMQVFDLTQLRSVTTPPVTFSETVHYGGVTRTHTIFINEDTGFAYLAGTAGAIPCSGGLHMVNVQNLTSPSFAGCVSSDGYTHETQCVIYTGPDATYQGHEICFNSNEDTLTLVDVTTKTLPIQLSRTSYPGVGYTHQGWLTDDQVYFLLDDELDESNFGHNSLTRIWNVSDLNLPVISGSYFGPTPAIDHNLYIRDGYVYEANYRAGLRILDLSGVAGGNLSEVGYFDVYPSSDSASFNGAWMAYPFFDSGVIVVNGIEQGLFILQPATTADFTLTASSTTLNVCTSGSDSLTLNLASPYSQIGDVNLSAHDVPTGTSISYSANPVSVPGSSVLTATVTGTPAGSYPFSVSGTNGVITRTTPVSLKVFNTPPGTSTLVSPAGGATNQSLRPQLVWTAAPQGENYDVEIAQDAGFGALVYTATLSGLSNTVISYLSQNTMYYWRVRARNLCGPGPYSTVSSFTTRLLPPVLLVDDDDNTPDVLTTYSGTLSSLGVSFDVWEVHNERGVPGLVTAPGHVNEPDAATLELYPAVVWFSGDTGAAGAGPGASAEGALGTFLDGGGCLLISSQDYYSSQGLTPFMTSYLGAASFFVNANYTAVTGQGAAFGGLGPYSLAYPFANRSDRVSPGPSAEVAFTTSSGNAAIARDSGAYRATYWGFPWEALPAAGREAALARFLTWCGMIQANVALAPSPQSQTGDLGTDVGYVLTITNTGNYTDTFALAASGAWNSTLSPRSTGPLGPSQNLAVTLTVTIPYGIAAGTVEVTTVTATSGLDNSVTKSVQVTTTGVWPRRFLPLVSKP